MMISGRMIAATASLTFKTAMLMMKIYNSLYLGKWKGKTSFQRFRAIKGDEFEFINICSEDPEKLMQIEKEMEAHNLLFARLPDLCGGDGNTQYVIARSDMNIFAAFLMDHIHGELKNIKVGPIAESDYAKTAVHPESGEYTQEFQDLNESAREEYAASRLQIGVEHKEEVLRLPLLKQRTIVSEEVQDTVTDILPEPEQLMMTRYGQRQEITFTALLMDPQIRLRNEILRRGEQMQLIYEEPVREGERFAAFPVHDGFHVVVVPKEDLLSGNTSRETQYRAVPIEKPPTAMLYTSKNYVVMDLRSGEKSICDGQSVMDLLSIPTLPVQKEQLQNLVRNIEKNVGSGALVPAMPKKHGGR